MQQTSRDMNPSEVRGFVALAHPTVLELGCNDGTDTNELLRVLPNARIYCFEPDPRAIKRFKETVNSNRVTLAEVAVSDRDGFAIFHGSSGQPPNKSKGSGASHYCFLDEWDLSGSLCKPTGHLAYSPWVTFPESRRYTVKTIRLDTWLESHPEITTIDFIWADVQGAESMMIRGAPRALARTKFLYTEFYNQEMYEGQPNLKAILALLPAFEVVRLYGKTNVLLGRKVG